ncbi:hypothetical protein C7S16_4964 [Burkholderia thailandensis]|uniref:Uncharacterized protein n=1 Tax=Burkholderia thailandensis TaxID=57975 RepID=A0AAW9D0J0_BURTH|nr:hypothetical protein [Burkholderia thailandensis]
MRRIFRGGTRIRRETAATQSSLKQFDILLNSAAAGLAG